MNSDPARTIKKRSFILAERKTSISLEDAFWSAAKEVAATRGLTVAAFIDTVDERRGYENLSSAVRLAVLAHFQELARRSDVDR